MTYNKFYQADSTALSRSIPSHRAYQRFQRHRLFLYCPARPVRWKWIPSFWLLLLPVDGWIIFEVEKIIVEKWRGLSSLYGNMMLLGNENIVKNSLINNTSSSSFFLSTALFCVLTIKSFTATSNDFCRSSSNISLSSIPSVSFLFRPSALLVALFTSRQLIWRLGVFENFGLDSGTLIFYTVTLYLSQ